MIWMGLAIGFLMGMVGTLGFLYDRGTKTLIEMEESEAWAQYWEAECVEERSRRRILAKKLARESGRVEALMAANAEIAEGNERLARRLNEERAKYELFMGGSLFSVN